MLRDDAAAPPFAPPFAHSCQLQPRRVNLWALPRDLRQTSCQPAQPGTFRPPTYVLAHEWTCSSAITSRPFAKN